jgi:hypothetical protein
MTFVCKKFELEPPIEKPSSHACCEQFRIPPLRVNVKFVRRLGGLTPRRARKYNIGHIPSPWYELSIEISAFAWQANSKRNWAWHEASFRKISLGQGGFHAP